MLQFIQPLLYHVGLSQSSKTNVFFIALIPADYLDYIIIYTSDDQLEKISPTSIIRKLLCTVTQTDANSFFHRTATKLLLDLCTFTTHKRRMFGKLALHVL